MKLTQIVIHIIVNFSLCLKQKSINQSVNQSINQSTNQFSESDLSLLRNIVIRKVKGLRCYHHSFCLLCKKHLLSVKKKSSLGVLQTNQAIKVSLCCVYYYCTNLEFRETCHSVTFYFTKITFRY